MKQPLWLECLIRRVSFYLMGLEGLPADINEGDWVMHPGWQHGPVKVVSVNWALRAMAIQLGPKGGIVVWTMSKGVIKTLPPKE